ncbi:hypothetical protein PPTG_03246 [Phytophthora nicotianae INRA-310]|uniref:CCHC-type domain-containing protein n=1 Tax=Phytophthora nicotianae (strain INRA-310) TaxID=761204 RepID=W2R479_PHYN3|nr:hypothetical protein PPTG_03246 [Phytophthora nicotianae INRA-310]ETN20188.1 hypothetical protein PPTG_03246 [Phytophthora nicotianae INRA-310]
MPTIAQLRAEIDRLNQAMADRTKVPNHLPKFTGKRGEDVREWLFQIENACRINNIPIEDTSARLPGIAGSAMEKPASGWFLHWSSTTRAEEHTWGIFREHVLQHFEASNYQSVLHKRKSSTDQAPSHDKSFKEKAFRGKGRFKPKTNPKRAEGRTCFHCKKPGHIKANCFLWKKEQEKQGNGQPRQ